MYGFITQQTQSPTVVSKTATNSSVFNIQLIFRVSDVYEIVFNLTTVNKDKMLDIHSKQTLANMSGRK